MADRTVRAILTGDSAGAVKAFTETAAASEIAGKRIEKSAASAGGMISKSLTDVIPGGEKATSTFEKLKNPWIATAVIAATAVIGIGAASLELADKYDSATAKMAATAGITKAQAEQIGDAFLTTSGQSVFSAQQIMTAYGPVSAQLTQVAGHTLNASDALGFMNQATTLAEASGTDLNTATSTLSKTLQSFHDPLSAATTDTNALYVASKTLGMPLSDFDGQLTKLHASLGDAGGGVTTLSAAMVDFQEHGEQGRKAVTALTTATTAMESPSKAALAELKAMGLGSQEAALKTGNMATIIADLSPKLQTMTQAQRESAEIALFGKNGYDQLNATLMAGTAGLQDATAAVTQHGTAQQAAATSTDTLGGNLDKAKASFANMGVEIGQRLKPIMDDFGRGLAIVTNWLAQNLPGALNFLGQVFTNIFNVIGTTISVTITIIQGIVSVVQDVVNSRVFHDIENTFSSIFGTIGTIVGGTISVIGSIAGAIATAANAIAGAAGAIIGAFEATFGWVYDHTIKPVLDAIDVVTNFLVTVGPNGQGAVNIINSGIGSVYGSLGNQTGATDAAPHAKHAAGGFFDQPHLGLVGDVPEFVMNVPQMAALIRGAQGGGGVSITQTFNIHSSDENLKAELQMMIEDNNADLADALSGRKAA